ncbi:MAG: quinolinate synthase NadA [Candidatus Riflebacteria bacterium]|nr:quinolinate synthase NadA [Candidatus Riflebacteria bacterium]
MATPPVEPFQDLSDQEVERRILAARASLGDQTIILGHHYQAEAVIRFADVIGDSYELAKKAAQSSARLIVFCGVHFMAESADILTRDDQTVVMPDLDAGCPMADMASRGEVEGAWVQLAELGRPDDLFLPVTYINSQADVKAFCGAHGGITCTSANAPKALRWALERRPKILFLPDQHLGRNTALAQGFRPEEIALWQPHLPLGGNTREGLARARILLWNGHCHVHSRFAVEHVAQARRDHPGAKVIVHPECCHEVVAASDLAGSTGVIVKVVKEAPAGSAWVIGTEVNLVSRLAREEPGKTILPLVSSMCPNMYKNSARDLLHVVENPGRINVVKVSGDVREPARLALQRMLDL